jgi:hypothetical protein
MEPNLPRAAATCGRQTCRRRESLGADSRVLRRVRPLNTSINAFGANFFSRREVDCAGGVAREKFFARYRYRVAFSRRDKNRDSAETLNPSAFLHYVDFRARYRARAKVFAAASCLRCSCASPASVGQGSYTQNLVE